MTEKSRAELLASQLADMTSMFRTPSHERGVCNGAVQELRRIPDLERQRDELLKALKMAVLQNDYDMLMTGEELRECASVIARVESTNG